MMVSKCSMDFKANKEISIAPVWVVFTKVPILFFLGKNQLNKLAFMLGNLLKIDAAKRDIRHPLVARLLIKVDVT